MTGNPVRRIIFGSILKVCLFVVPSFFSLLFVVVMVEVASGLLVDYVRGKTDLSIYFWAFLVAHYVLAAYLGNIVLRLGARLMPLQANGQRNWLSCALLICTSVSLICAFFWAFKYIIPSISTRTLPGRDLHPLVQFSLAMQGIEAEIWVVLAITGTGILAALLIPGVILLYRHFRPSFWTAKPYVLFLRRFSGLSNTIGVAPLLQGVPRGFKVVFLAGPHQQAKIWDPFSIGIAGISLLNPLKSVPICLKTDDSDWRNSVRWLANQASCIVMDVTLQSASIEEEIQIIRSLGPDAHVLWMKQDTIGQSDFEAAELGSHASPSQSVQLYSTYWLPAIPRILFASVFTIMSLAFMINLAIGLLLRAIGVDDTGEMIQMTEIASWIISILMSVPIIGSISFFPSFNRASKDGLRREIQHLCDASRFMGNHRCTI